MDEETPKKRRKKRRPPEARREGRRKGPADSAPSETKPSPRDRRVRTLIWLSVLLLAVGELWLFGRNGDITVCVGREGDHDFALIGQPRTDENTRRYPTCERRLNVGLRSQYDERVEEAMLHACRRATVLRGKETTIACALKSEGWEHRIDAHWVPPWRPEYYRRLFWFFF